MKLSAFFSGLMISASTFAIATASPVISTAMAQEQKAKGLVLEEIVVTSRKRTESLLDVPLTVTALTADDINVKSIKELTDIVTFAPGFFYGTPTVGRNDRSNRRLLMRGMQINTGRLRSRR